MTFHDEIEHNLVFRRKIRMGMKMILDILAWTVISLVVVGLVGTLVIITLATKGLFLILPGLAVSLIWALIHVSSN